MENVKVNLKEIKNYVNDKLEGESKSYHYDGQLMAISYYINSIKQ
jgi:antitoxin component YwqK of YwqJK toxin-antitoxin module